MELIRQVVSSLALDLVARPWSSACLYAVPAIRHIGPPPPRPGSRELTQGSICTRTQDKGLIYLRAGGGVLAQSGAIRCWTFGCDVLSWDLNEARDLPNEHRWFPFRIDTRPVQIGASFFSGSIRYSFTSTNGSGATGGTSYDGRNNKPTDQERPNRWNAFPFIIRYR
jgi:hypothetical protein